MYSRLLSTEGTERSSSRCIVVVFVHLVPNARLSIYCISLEDSPPTKNSKAEVAVLSLALSPRVDLSSAHGAPVFPPAKWPLLLRGRDEVPGRRWKKGNFSPLGWCPPPHLTSWGSPGSVPSPLPGGVNGRRDPHLVLWGQLIPPGSGWRLCLHLPPCFPLDTSIGKSYRHPCPR